MIYRTINRVRTAQTVEHRDDDDTTARNLCQGKALPPNAPGSREAKDDSQKLISSPENNTGSTKIGSFTGRLQTEKFYWEIGSTNA